MVQFYNTNGILPQYCWPYEMMGAASYVSPSILSPNDSMGALNDTMLFNNNAGVDRLVNDSTYLYQNTMPMMNNFMANMAKYWQEMMLNMSKIRAGIVGGAGGAGGSGAVGSGSSVGSGKLSEDKIISTLEKMGAGDAVSDRVNQKITVNGKETTILRRLIELCDGYRKDPENAEISKENYETVWEIAGRYAKNGTISSEDFATLKKIALDPKSSDKPEEKEEKVAARPVGNIRERANKSTGIDQIADDFFEAMDGCGTDKPLMRKASQNVNKDNVLEVVDSFNKKNKYKDGLNIIEKIFDDMDDWGSQTYWLTDDAAKPFVTDLSTALVERTQQFIKNAGADKEVNKELKDAVDALNLAISNAGDAEDLDDNSRKNIAKLFMDLHTKLSTAEKAAYEKFDEQMEYGEIQ